MLKNRSPYQDSGAAAYEAKYREQELTYLQRKAAKLGFDPQNPPLVPNSA